jgi:hypothetical protein
MKFFMKVVGAMSGAAVLGFLAAPVGCTAKTTVVDGSSGTARGDGGTDDTASDGGSTGTGGGTGTTGDLCEDSCAKAASAECENQASCVEDCEKQMSQIPDGCTDEMEAALECAIEKGTFECNASGKATAKGCDAEGMALFECLQSGGGGGGGKCDELQTGDPTCDACMDASCCAQESACLDEPDCLDFFGCLAKGTPQATCQTMHPTGHAVASGVNQCMNQKCSAQCAE